MEKPEISPVEAIHVSSKGYAGFGSFQTDRSVEAMISEAEATYVPPARGVSTLDLWDAGGAAPAFGEGMRGSFLLDPSWTFINHGAFGGVCRVALAASQRWALHAELQPLRFIDRELFPLMCHSLRCLAAHVRAPATALALVPNATYALSSILASLPLPQGATLFCLDIGYGSVRHMLQAAAARVGGRLVVGKVTFPLPGGAAQLLAQVLPQIPAACAAAVFDFVTSNTGMVLPVRELVAAAKAAGALVLVDGAHALGAFELDLPALGADYFVSNCHKWLCSSRGLGMLYSAAGSPLPRPAIISHGHGSGFTSEFVWDGCRDYSAAVALPTLLEWWQWVGLQQSRAYCRGLLRAAVQLLTSRWGTGTHVPEEFYSHMACVQLPEACLPPGALLALGGAEGGQAFRCTSVHSKMLQDALHHGFAIEVPTKTLPGPLGGEDSRTYVRISAFVYNSLADYEALADAVLRITWGGEAEQGAGLTLAIQPPPGAAAESAGK